uniref:Putative secreted peptide n=1 Tax=Anopheles braziliensis TaxID=58242 RepID=A0A2M3ZY05_9DIPT
MAQWITVAMFDAPCSMLLLGVVKVEPGRARHTGFIGHTLSRTQAKPKNHFQVVFMGSLECAAYYKKR